MAGQSAHDRARMERGLAALGSEDLDVLDDAIVGLQSTDDPTLVPLHDELQRRSERLRRATETDRGSNYPDNTPPSSPEAVRADEGPSSVRGPD